MSARIGINGFGRMGRLGFRAAFGWDDLQFVLINEIACDAAGSAHLLEFDSIHGRYDRHCESSGDELVVDGHAIPHTRNAPIEDTDWSGCDVVVEATGKYRKPEQLDAYFRQGVKKVVVAAPVDGALNIVVGINHHLYEPDVHHVVTAASCTTNCLAPMVKVMHETLGIVHGVMTTIHDITNTQTIIDKGHKDLRRARAGGLSLIPTSTGSAKAIARIFPELEGKLYGIAVRVPLLNASLTDFVFESRRPTSVEEVNGLFRNAADGELASILGYEERPLVSIDFKTDPRSAILDAPSTMVVDGTQVKLLAWYDNEWGYANRLMELAGQVARSL